MRYALSIQLTRKCKLKKKKIFDVKYNKRLEAYLKEN